MLPGANIQDAIARLRRSQAKPGMGMPGQPGMDQLGGGGGMPPQGPMGQLGGDPMSQPMPTMQSGLQGMAMPAQLPPQGFGPAGGQAPMQALGDPNPTAPPAGPFGGAPLRQEPLPPAGQQPWSGGGIHQMQDLGGVYRLQQLRGGMGIPGGNMAPQMGATQMAPQPDMKPGQMKPGAQVKPAVRPPAAQPPSAKAPAPMKPAVAAQARRVGGLVNQIADFKPQTPGGSELAKPAAVQETAAPQPGSVEERRTAMRNIAAARPKTR